MNHELKITRERTFKLLNEDLLSREHPAQSGSDTDVPEIAPGRAK